jgi:hypothetical protein
LGTPLRSQAVQYRPTASELLGDIATLLADEVLPAAPPELQHKVRVAANLARILEREERLAPGLDARERELLTALVGHDGELGDLRAELVERLGGDVDDAFERAAWEALVEVTRGDLSIAKPGYDGWEGP